MGEDDTGNGDTANGDAADRDAADRDAADGDGADGDGADRDAADGDGADRDGDAVEDASDSSGGHGDALEEADVDWEMAPESDAVFVPDAEKRTFLREIADEVRGNSSESDQVAAILYRISDLYDPDENTSPEEIYLNVRHIMRIKAQGGIER